MHKQRVNSVLVLVAMLQEGRDARRIDVEQQRSEPARETPPDAAGPRGAGTPEPERDTAGVVPPTSDGVDAQAAGTGRDIRRESANAAGASVGTQGDATPTSVEVVEPREATRRISNDRESRTGRDVSHQEDTGEGAGQGTTEATWTQLEDRAVGEGGRRSGRLDERSHGGVKSSGDVEKTWVPTPDSRIVKGRRVSLMETISLAAVASPDVSDIQINISNDFLQLYSDAQKKAIRLMLLAHEAHVEPAI